MTYLNTVEWVRRVPSYGASRAVQRAVVAVVAAISRGVSKRDVRRALRAG